MSYEEADARDAAACSALAEAEQREAEQCRLFVEQATYLAMLGSGPLMTGDAIVVLCGEDAEPRIACALELFVQQAAPRILLSGGRDEPPRIHGAKWLKQKLVGFGVSPKAILLETDSMHTREQAVNVVRLALDKDWKRLLVVASPYHAFRAHLTFVQALIEAGADDGIRVVMVPASQSRWFTSPEGTDQTRAHLFPGELAKIAEYQVKGDVASYAEGLAYLQHWELAK